MIKKLYDWSKRVVMRFLDNNCSTHAAGLTFFSLLAVVPVLCCTLVIAKACGVDQYAKRELNHQLDVMIVQIQEGQWRHAIETDEFAAQARQVSDKLFVQIEQFNVNTLGWIGFGFLLWTVISSLASVETSFNEIMGDKEPRSWWKRIVVYLLLMLVLPLPVAIAISLPVLGYLFGAVFFILIYRMLPHCPVRFLSAVKGGLLTLFLFVGCLKLCAFAQVGIAKSSALYGSFAFLPIVLTWLYISWQIILFGACMVKEFERPPRDR